MRKIRRLRISGVRHNQSVQLPLGGEWRHDEFSGNLEQPSQMKLPLPGMPLSPSVFRTASLPVSGVLGGEMGNYPEPEGRSESGLSNAHLALFLVLDAILGFGNPYRFRTYPETVTRMRT
jgi:hypothetical protein